MRGIDMTGRKCGRWTVLAPVTGRGAVRWLCRCECGSEREVWGQTLRNGSSRSCGCLASETTSRLRGRHRMSGTPEYVSWSGMIARCMSPTNPAFPRYGGRGISVCERWLVFERFFEDMGPKPSARHSIDRINNDGNYEPGNCRWASSLEQQANRSSTRLVTLTLGALSRISGVDHKKLWRRLRAGWTVEEAAQP